VLTKFAVRFRVGRNCLVLLLLVALLAPAAFAQAKHKVIIDQKNRWQHSISRSAEHCTSVPL